MIPLEIKICGITQTHDAVEAARMGASALGFIFVPGAARQVSPAFAAKCGALLPPQVRRIGVFQDQSLEQIQQIAYEARLTGLQLHGLERPSFLRELKSRSPELLLIKALDVATTLTPRTIADFTNCADVILFDAPRASSASLPTAETPNLKIARQLDDVRLSRLLQDTQTARFWIAGGLNADNVAHFVQRLSPQGVDVSSGVERELSTMELQPATLNGKLTTSTARPRGAKDLNQVADFIRAAKGAADATR